MSQKKTKNSVSFEALSSLDAPVSFWKGIPFGLQHVMAMFVANLAPIFIVANAAKMTSAQSAAVIQSGLLVAGLGTCLQLYGAWLIGSRLPMVTGISFTYVAAAAAICADKGYGAVVGAVIVGGLLELVLGLTARYWRRFVPPIVSAIVVTSIGFSLLTVGATSFGGGDASAADFGSWQNLTLGLISLVACLAFQLLMKGTANSCPCCSAWWSAMWWRFAWARSIFPGSRSFPSFRCRSSCRSSPSSIGARSSPSDCCTWSRPSRFWETPPH